MSVVSARADGTSVGDVRTKARCAIRIVAFALDLAGLLVLTQSVGHLVGASVGTGTFALWLLLLCYRVVLHHLRGLTVGKLALGIEVCDAASGGRPGWVQSAVREAPVAAFLASSSILKSVGWALALLGHDTAGLVVPTLGGLAMLNAAVLWLLAEAVVMATDPAGRAIHDLSAGTVVVRR